MIPLEVFDAVRKLWPAGNLELRRRDHDPRGGESRSLLLARGHLRDPYWTRHAAYGLEWPDQYKSLERFRPRFV